MNIRRIVLPIVLLTVYMPTVGSALPSAAADNLQSKDPAYLATLCRDHFSADQVQETLESCYALDLLMSHSKAAFSAIANERASGKELTFVEFTTVFLYVSYVLLADYNRAAIAFRHNHLDFGRKYAVQAVEWSFFSAKNTHDALVNLRKWLHEENDDSEYPSERARLEAALAKVKAVAPDMDRAYPGVRDEAATELRMSRATVDKIMQGF